MFSEHLSEHSCARRIRAVQLQVQRHRQYLSSAELAPDGLDVRHIDTHSRWQSHCFPTRRKTRGPGLAGPSTYFKASLWDCGWRRGFWMSSAVEGQCHASGVPNPLQLFQRPWLCAVSGLRWIAAAANIPKSLIIYTCKVVLQIHGGNLGSVPSSL